MLLAATTQQFAAMQRPQQQRCLAARPHMPVTRPITRFSSRRQQQQQQVANIDTPLTVDPAAAALSTDEHVPGQLWTVHSPQQLDAALERHRDQLVVLMCKSKACRPCKVFLKKYASIAARFPEIAALQIFGDESPDTRRLMVSMGVKVTPTFALYRGGERVATVTGVSETKLLRAVVDALTPAEREAHAEDVFELEAAEAEQAAAASAEAAANAARR